ncbi:flavin reductase family protein [Facklamia miroungae]|uniref:NADH-FMN oxidoreductase RutF, flavin reductase (DIM6/NTAB) family n=1 Tax=Facklamia miroungae TaxID=120956 RepID=A0A1G7QGU5_9LACT|nr:flavin reductase family protein [Facklamia miroungae]NKZ28936.1 flavin reductase family protein [Facklamia miroungae]SDF97734.1 NADH-FMN oxidoreductase RutF, flavin reductase (DIM6/NTAB) family [Facklamia miroungae]
MLSFNVTELTQKEQYKLLIGSVIPRPVALIASLNDDQSINLAPFSYFNMVSYNPPILMVSVQRKGKMKDTARNILANKEAVFHVVSQENLADVNQTASNLPKNKSELELTQFTLASSHSIQTPGIAEMKVRYETVLHQHIEIPSTHPQFIAADLLLMRVVHFHLSEEVYQNTYILADQLKPISRLAGNDYATLGDIIQLERPE